MAKLTRRDLLKTGAVVTAGALLKATPEISGESLTQMPAAPLGVSPRRRQRLDAGWRFTLGHADDPRQDQGFEQMRRGELTFAKATGVARPASARFDDSGWQAVDLPHDWAIDLEFRDDAALPDHGGKPLGREYPATSIGWYRRVINLGEPDLNSRVWVEFDGVFRDAMVFFNGQYIFRNFSGYAPFRCDLTDYFVAGANALAVRVDATTGEGWFYEGAGIYRHVWLTQTAPVRVEFDSLVARATPRGNGAEVELEAEAVNDSTQASAVWGEWRVYGPDGTQVGSARTTPAQLAAGVRATLNGRVTLQEARRWTLEDPALYRCEFSLHTASGETDRAATGFGVRSLRFDADHGFFLNDKAVKIKGTCNHHDHAGVGVAVPDALQLYRVRALKAMGSNACRTSHNPPSEAFLEACDAVGMLVMAETRMNSATPEGLSQLTRLVRRSRNHPSVILWSLGNEEPQQGSATGGRVSGAMKRLAARLDPTRPVTQAMNGGWETRAAGGADGVRAGASGVIDVQGCNYGEENIDRYHRDFPATPVVGSETASAVATRGVYFADKEKGYVTAYDTNVPGSYAKTAEAWWRFYAAREWLAGGFAWTGFDYRGEPSPSQWPCCSSHFGIMDTCGFPKDSYYYYRAWWTEEPTLHLFPHWNWEGREGQTIAVWCHTNCETVELFLNGTSLGARQVEANGHSEWQVAYAAGRLEARGTRRGQALTARRETAGAAAGLELDVDRQTLKADGADVVICSVEVRDAQGRAVPTAGNLVRFTVDGPGRVLGVGNGDPASHEADRATQRSAFNGLCMALVQSTGAAGAITVRAEAEGLAPATVTFVSS